MENEERRIVVSKEIKKKKFDKKTEKEVLSVISKEDGVLFAFGKTFAFASERDIKCIYSGINSMSNNAYEVYYYITISNDF